MGLDLLPHLEDHAVLVANKNKVFKLKITYKDGLTSKDKGAFAESVSRQEAHNQIEEVLRAVLYILERDRQLQVIQTDNFVVHPKTAAWVLANKIEFLIDDKVLYCYPDCLIFEVQCKPSMSSINKKANVTAKSSYLDHNLQQSSKGKDGPNRISRFDMTACRTQTQGKEAVNQISSLTETDLEVRNSPQRRLSKRKNNLPQASKEKDRFLDSCVRDAKILNERSKETGVLKIDISACRTRTQVKKAKNQISSLSETSLISNPPKRGYGKMKKTWQDKIENTSSSNSLISGETSYATVTNRDSAVDVTEMAKHCIKRYRRENVASFKKKSQLMPKNSDCNDNASGTSFSAVETESQGDSLKQRLISGESPKNFEKQRLMLNEDQNSFEIQDSHMVELHHKGSVISKTVPVQRTLRKRRFDSPEYLEKKYAGNRVNDVVVQKKHKFKASNRKRRLYNENNSFALSNNTDNLKSHLPSNSVSLSHSALYETDRHKVGKINRYLRNQRNIVSSRSGSSNESSSSQIRECSKGKEETDAKVKIRKQYQELMANNYSIPKFKCGPQRDTSGTIVPNNNFKAVNSNVDHLDFVNGPNCRGRKTPKMTPKSQNFSKHLPFKGGPVHKKGEIQKKQSFIDSQPSSILIGQKNTRQHSASVSSCLSGKSALLKQSSRNLQGVKKGTRSLSPLRKKFYGKSQKARSDSKLKEFRLTRSRLLAAKDGVWLMPTSLFSNASKTKQKESRRKSQPSPKATKKQGISSLSPSPKRTRKSASSPCLTTPESFMSPVSAKESQQKEGTKRSGRRSKFFQVLASIFRLSK